MKNKIAIILGTRAELIKTFPVMVELQKNKIPYYFIHTGQHNLRDLCEIFNVKKPDIILTKEPEKSSKFNANALKALFWNFSLIFKIRNDLAKMKDLKYVIYHGDTMTTASAAIASSRFMNPFKKYKNVHLEAGLRSKNIFEPFPEEISRKISDRYSDILLAASENACNSLKKYKNSKNIINFGNTVIDSAEQALKLAIKRKIKPLSKNKFALISVHRHENIKDKKRLSEIVDILSSLKINSYFTLHDNTRKQLENFGLLKKLKENKNIKIIEPLDYASFVYQIKNCSIIICDGGSMQEESLIFKKPCIILRKYTERQEGLASNFQFLSSLNVERTTEKIKEYTDSKFKIEKFNNPYGKKGLSKKIINILK